MSMPDSDVSHPNSSLEVQEFARSVKAGLSHPTQKELPSKYLYDEVGSALFETITVLKEYGVMRAGERLLQRHAPSIIECVPPPVVVAELGSGTGRKTRWVLEALAKREPVTYYPIDVSASALAMCEQNLGLLEDVSIVGLEASYLDGLKKVSHSRRDDQSLLVLFLGSTIGNFERPAAEKFLREVRACMKEGDGFLLATDLVKNIDVLKLAYDDPAGVTAAFDRNILVRINRELGGDFDLKHFVHEARYNEEFRRIEMHLRSTKEQTVSIAAAKYSCTFQKDETIWTECSHKYTVEELPGMAHRNGFRSEGQWVDMEWPLADNLWLAA